MKPTLVNPEDITVYEIHVRDFSVNDPSVAAEGVCQVMDAGDVTEQHRRLVRLGLVSQRHQRRIRLWQRRFSPRRHRRL